jgi:hypothetical protein
LARRSGPASGRPDRPAPHVRRHCAAPVLATRDIAPGDAISRILFIDADATLPTLMDGQTLDMGRLNLAAFPT